MKRLVILLLLVLGTSGSWAMVALTDRVTVIVDKPGIGFKVVPFSWQERWRKALGAREIRIDTGSFDIPLLTIVASSIEKVSRLTTSVDLGPWFSEKSCLVNWDVFHRCLNEKRSAADEELYRTIERKFVSRIACGTGQKCPDATFRLWRLQWPTPASIRLEADVGKGGFRSLRAARKSLHVINSLLKKTLYGARFPENFGEGRSEHEVFSLHRVRLQSDFGKAVRRILLDLVESGFLKGLSKRDIAAIAQNAKGGKIVYYRSLRCFDGQQEGWFAISNAARVRFDPQKCPRFEILR